MNPNDEIKVILSLLRINYSSRFFFLIFLIYLFILLICLNADSVIHNFYNYISIKDVAFRSLFYILSSSQEIIVLRVFVRVLIYI